MNLDTRDAHLILNRGSRTGKLYAAGGHLLEQFEARNRTVNDGTYLRWGNCPPGEFILGKPVAKNTAPFGPFFILLEDYGDNHAMAGHRRSGIGLHGGGSGLPRPLIPKQSPPWIPTHGCWRMLNSDLELLVHLVSAIQGVGGTVYVTVEPPSPMATDSPDDDLAVNEADLAPDE